MHKQINLLAPGRYPWCTHGGCPLVANQIDLFMHFLGASEDGLVKRPVEMDKISSSELSYLVRVANNACMRLVK